MRKLDVRDLQLGRARRPATAQSSLQSNWNASPGRKRQRHEGAAARWSAAPAAGRPSRPARRPRPGRRSRRSRAPPDRHATASACASACATCRPRSSASADSFSANGSSLLGRSGTLNFGSTASARRYLRIVLRDRPVRRAISRIGSFSRKCQRRITLNNRHVDHSCIPRRATARGKVQTWVNSQWKLCAPPGSALSGNQQRGTSTSNAHGL